MAELDAAHVERWRGYFYPETLDGRREATLRNLAGIRDLDLAKDYEYSMTAMRQVQLDLGRVDIPRTYDVDHLRAIHRHLFQDVYEWAGEFRTVDMKKAGKAFARIGSGNLEKYLEDVATHIAETPWGQLDEEHFARAMAQTFAPLNQAHPFREGNGRTSKVFLEHVAERSGFVLNYNRVEPIEWNLRSQSSRPMDNGITPRPEKIEGVFRQISTARAVERHPPRLERPTIKSLFAASYPQPATAATERRSNPSPQKGRHARREHQTGPRNTGPER